MMKSNKSIFILCVLFFVVFAAVTFRCTWPADHVFSGSDLNIGRLAQMKRNLPASFSGAFTANQLLGNSGYRVSLLKVLLFAMPLEMFLNSFYGLILVVGSVSMLWFLRLWGRSWFAAIFGALVAFWINSVLLAHVGHAYKQEVLVFSVLTLCLVEKSVRAESIRHGVGFSLLAGLSVGVMMIEQQDVALLAGLFAGSYTLFRLVQVHRKSARQWISVLVPLATVSLLLSGDTLLGSYKHNIVGAAAMQQQDAGGREQKWNYVTQWSAVPEEWPDLIALGWGGWSSNNPKGPYWGKLGRSAEWESTGQGFRNFKLNSVYFGTIPFLLGAFGLAAALKNRRSETGAVVLFWCVAGLIGFWLAFGKYSLLYKMFYHLPLVNNIRAPIKLLDNFQICLAIAAAYGLDSLISVGKGGKAAKWLWITAAVCGGLMLLAGLKLVAFPTSQLAEFSKMGYESYADTLVGCMSNAWFHASVLTLLCGGLAFTVWKGFKAAKWVPLAFIAAVAADSLILTSHHFRADDIGALKRGNGVINYLKENQGNERTAFMDPSGIYNQWLASDGPYHGLNLFNIWQMPRMPVEYQEYLGKLGRNQIRLWQLSAVKYVAAPAHILQQIQQNPELGSMFNPVMDYQVPTAQGMRPDVLLEFKGAIPRFALFQNWQNVPLAEQCDRLASRGHDPRTTVLLDPSANVEGGYGNTVFEPLEANVAGRSATVSVSVKEKAIVRFAQYFQPNWRVFVDNQPADLLRVDYLCMGVAVEPGEHVVEFRCVGGGSKTARLFGGFVVSCVLGGWLAAKPTDRRTLA
jgi:hypothetical protein